MKIIQIREETVRQTDWEIERERESANSDTLYAESRTESHSESRKMCMWCMRSTGTTKMLPFLFSLLRISHRLLCSFVSFSHVQRDSTHTQIHFGA